MNSATTYTKAALFAFLKKAETTGIYKANTVSGLRAAAIQLLEDIQDNEDVRAIDVEQTVQRYHNKHPSKLSPASLGEYQRRLRRLLEEFSGFNENPAGYKPKGRVTATNNNKTAGKGDQKTQAKRPDTKPTQLDVTAQSMHMASVSAPSVPMLRLSYPIRDDVLAEIAVPRGMNSEEARRLCAFIMTLARDFAPS